MTRPSSCSFSIVPEISSNELRSRVFNTDPPECPNHEFEDPAADKTPAAEKYALENLGDSVLRLVVTSLILDTYSRLRVAPSIKLRELLMDNAMLDDMCLRQVRFPRCPDTTAFSIQGNHIFLRVFVGALYLDQGLEPVKPWLRAVFLPHSIKVYDLLRDLHGSSKQGSPAVNTTPSPPSLPSSTLPGSPASPLALLNECVQKGNRRVDWAFVNHEAGSSGGALQSPSRENSKTKTAVWVAEVLVDGEVFGRGEGNTKKAARSEAAKQALPQLGVSV
ncbi:hypothetical protein C8R47DRAFT_967163 [Mycena vitilis]|nr:hypothetical protein C8R47DRAFT_967163 [Mycena vitilis]